MSEHTALADQLDRLREAGADGLRITRKNTETTIAGQTVRRLQDRGLVVRTSDGEVAVAVEHFRRAADERRMQSHARTG